MTETFEFAEGVDDLTVLCPFEAYVLAGVAPAGLVEPGAVDHVPVLADPGHALAVYVALHCVAWLSVVDAAAALERHVPDAVLELAAHVEELVGAHAVGLVGAVGVEVLAVQVAAVDLVAEVVDLAGVAVATTVVDLAAGAAVKHAAAGAVVAPVVAPVVALAAVPVDVPALAPAVVVDVELDAVVVPVLEEQLGATVLVAGHADAEVALATVVRLAVVPSVGAEVAVGLASVEVAAAADVDLILAAQCPKLDY